MLVGGGCGGGCGGSCGGDVKMGKGLLFVCKQILLGNNTYRPCTISAYSIVTTFSPMASSPRGAMPQPPGPKALLRMRRYLISGR